MTKETPLLLAPDLTGTFVFALNGALTAIRAVRLDIVGVITLGMVRSLRQVDSALKLGLRWQKLRVSSTSVLSGGVSNKLDDLG
jgi:hypothetical protein